MRDKIIQEARTWLETPFQHQGRKKGVGVDCVGLVEQVGFSLGLAPADYVPVLNYSQSPTEIMTKILNKYLKQISKNQITQGSILFFKTSPRALWGQHLGFYTRDNTLIHAYSPKNKVVEVTFSALWKKQLIAAYDFIGVN